jgi:hypothetical protein
VLLDENTMYRGAKMMITVTITFLYGVDHRTIHIIQSVVFQQFGILSRIREIKR